MFRQILPILLITYALPVHAIDLEQTANAWTQEIAVTCAASIASSDEDKLACAWPAVFGEFMAAKKEISSDSKLLLSLASGVFEFDQFEIAKPIDARVARYLISIRYLRQTWPFALKKLSIKNFSLQSLVTSAMTTTDGWSSVWSAYSNLDCTKNSTRDCLRAKAVFLVSLNAAVSQIDANIPLKLMINSALDSGTTDVILGGDIKRTRESLEHIVGSFTGANASFYFCGAGDPTLLLAKTKLAEWTGYVSTAGLFEGEVKPVDLANDACANLMSQSPSFKCRSRADGGIEVIDRPIWANLWNPAVEVDLSVAASIEPLRQNLASVMRPTQLEPSRLTLIKLLHEISSFDTASKNLKTLSASIDLHRIGTSVAPDQTLVTSLVNELIETYSDAQKAGVQ